MLALTLRAMIPLGFMPELQPQQSGHIMQLVICTGHGADTVTVDSARFAPQPGKAKSGHAGSKDSCPFAPVLAQDAAQDAPLILPSPPVRDNVRLIAAAQLPGGALVKNWLSQGPPLS
jgi:hypothetical protein